MSIFERFLTIWVAFCIIAGIALGHFFPAVFHAIGSAEIAKVNLPVAVLIWLMIIPMLMKIDFAALRSPRIARLASFVGAAGSTDVVNHMAYQLCIRRPSDVT